MVEGRIATIIGNYQEEQRRFHEETPKEIKIKEVLQEIQRSSQQNSESDENNRLIFNSKIDFQELSRYNNLKQLKLIFSDIAFEEELLNLEYLNQFHTIFERCIFKKHTSIRTGDKQFSQNLNFTFCCFEDVLQLGGTFLDINLYQSSFKELYINDCTFQETNFNSINSQKTTIQGATFNTSFQCLGSTLMDFIMINSTFMEECLFYEKSMMSTYGISKLFGNNDNDNDNDDDEIINNTFKKKADFTKCELDKVKFTNSTFEDKAIFYNATLTDCNFSRTKFDGEADFKDSILTNCDFSFTRFMDEADFKRVKFHGKNIFEYTQFNDRGAFYGASFDNNPTFHNLILGKESHIYFSKLNKHLDTNENLKPINRFTMRDTIINGRMDLDDNNINILDMKGCVIAGTLSRVQFNNITCANWETATLLKHEELKIDNLIRALEYKAEEKDLYSQWLDYKIINTLLKNVQNTISIYKKYLKKHKKERYSDIIQTQLECYKDEESKLSEKKKNLIKRYDIVEKDDDNQVSKAIVQLYFEKGSLLLSKIANNHGQSWGQGLLFTSVVWIGCFVVFSLPNPFYIQCENILPIWIRTISRLSFWGDFIKYLSPTEYTLLINYIKDSPVHAIVKFFGAIWFLLGKALVPYGIFEVVQAFRKYNKID